MNYMNRIGNEEQEGDEVYSPIGECPRAPVLRLTAKEAALLDDLITSSDSRLKPRDKITQIK